MSSASILVQSLGWTLVHSFWQGALVYGVLRLLFVVSSGLTARFRYHAAYFSLTALFAWFLVSFVQQWQRFQSITVGITEGTFDAADQKTLLVKTVPQQTGILAHDLLAQTERYFPFLILAYLSGVLFLSLRFAGGLVRLHMLRKGMVAEPPRHVTEMLEDLRLMLGINRNVRIRLSLKVQAPVVFGTLRPVILLPLATLSQLSTSQLEAILLHELAHIKRNDYFLNVLQSVMETVLFFNPFTWLISSLVRREREYVCDDLVLEHTDQSIPYARALATLEASRKDGGHLALAATGRPNHLLHRIKRIVEMKKQPLNYSHLLLTILIVSTLVVSIAWFTPAFAQEKRKPAKKEERKPEIVKKEKIVVVDDNGERKEYNSTDELPLELQKTLKESLDASGKALDVAGVALDATGKALAEIDIASITKNVSETLKDIDWEGISEEVNNAMKDVDWDEINREVEEGLREAGKELKDPKLKEEIRVKIRKAQAEARRAMEEGHRDMEEARRDMEDARKDMADAREDMAKERAEAAKHRAVVRVMHDRSSSKGGYSYENMLKKMDSDGLIDRDRNFTIKKYDDQLYINGEEQSRRVYEKYAPYLKGDNIIIKGRGDNLRIRVRD